MPKNAEIQRQQEMRLKMLQELSAFTEVYGSPEEQEEDNRPVRRSDVPPPAAPEKDERLNPDGIVDIITFCEHDFYLGLNLTPWQKLIVKCFYAGTEGNSHLKIDDQRAESGCQGCVWANNRKSEERFCRDLKNKVIPLKQPNMLPENSPCLRCSRYDPQLKSERFAYLKSRALNDKGRMTIVELESRFEEDLYLTEMGLLYLDEFKEKVRNQVLEKFGNKFQELILVLGRRSGKSFMVSIIALYELYRFIMMGHPQSRYPLMEFDVITFLNVGTSERVAKQAIFDKIRQLVIASPFFKPYISQTKTPTQTEMWFCTPYDIAENERRAKSGDPLLDGTLQMLSGHSSGGTLVGNTAACIIIDEMAAMAGSEGSDGGTDSDLYAMLKPSVATFGMDGKIICISNPLGPHGKFYELYESSFLDPTTLMLQLPTWLSNPNIEQSFLRGEELKDPLNFGMHYGADFGGVGLEPWLPKEAVQAAFPENVQTRRREFGEPLIRYFMHLDPAYSSDYYTLCVLHAEPVEGLKNEDGTPQMRIIVDHIHYFPPLVKGQPINIDEVDKYVLELAKRFRVVQVSYDQHWSSQASITKMKAAGLNPLCTPFVHSYQATIYQELYDLFTSNRIEFYTVDTMQKLKNARGEEYLKNLNEVEEAKQQFYTLQHKWKNGKPKIEALKGKRDDIPDCIAGAAFQALKDRVYSTLPRSRLVRPTALRRGLR